MSVVNILKNASWEVACQVEDLIAHSGICVLLGGQQVAIFYLPDESPSVYALENWDPIGKANVMSRGIVGSIGDELVVASPLYKQHFCLATGACIEDSTQNLACFEARVVEGLVQVFIEGR